MSIKQIEEIEAWQAARSLAREIYRISENNLFKKDFRLSGQIRDAATSIMANIAEGFDSQSDQDFVRFLVFSRRSATEVISHLYVALDQQYIDQTAFNDLTAKINKTKNLVCGFIRYLKKKQHYEA